MPDTKVRGVGFLGWRPVNYSSYGSKAVCMCRVLFKARVQAYMWRCHSLHSSPAFWKVLSACRAFMFSADPRFSSVFFFKVLSSFRVFMFIVPSLSLPLPSTSSKLWVGFVYIYYMSMFSFPLPSSVFFSKALRLGFRGLMFSAPPPPPPPNPFSFSLPPRVFFRIFACYFCFFVLFFGCRCWSAYWPTMLLLLFCFAWHCILFVIT